jgi:hypothetical protein
MILEKIIIFENPHFEYQKFIVCQFVNYIFLSGEFYQKPIYVLLFL